MIPCGGSWTRGSGSPATRSSSAAARRRPARAPSSGSPSDPGHARRRRGPIHVAVPVQHAPGDDAAVLLEVDELRLTARRRGAWSSMPAVTASTACALRRRAARPARRGGARHARRRSSATTWSTTPGTGRRRTLDAIEFLGSSKGSATSASWPCGSASSSACAASAGCSTTTTRPPAFSGACGRSCTGAASSANPRQARTT